MRMHGDEDEDALSLEVELDAPPAKVWRALTVRDFLERWLLAPPPAANAPPREPSQDARPPRARRAAGLQLLDAEAERFVRYRLSEDEAGLPDSLVTFRIAPNAAGGTTFRIVHRPLPAARAPFGMTAANANGPIRALAA